MLFSANRFPNHACPGSVKTNWGPKVLVANWSIIVKLNFGISVAFCSFHKPYWPPLSSTVSGKLSENYNMPVFLNL